MHLEVVPRIRLRHLSIPLVVVAVPMVHAAGCDQVIAFVAQPNLHVGIATPILLPLRDDGGIQGRLIPHS